MAYGRIVNACLDGGMRTLSEIMAELRKKLPAAGGGGKLLATGQTKCYNTAGQEIDCNSTDWPGQDGFYQIGSSMENRFVDNGDGTVTDNYTGLMWQQTSAPGTYNWQNALKYCESLELAGHSDWRLPNVNEFRSIFDYGRVVPALDPWFDVVSTRHWSSSTNVLVSDRAYLGVLDSGLVFLGIKTRSYYVLAVRGRP